MQLIKNPDGTPIDPPTLPVTWYRNDEGECVLSANPKDPENLAFMTNSDLFGAPDFPNGVLGTTVFYTKDGGCTWNQSNLVTTRFQDGGIIQTEYATEPGVSFDLAGNLHAVFTPYNLYQNFNEMVAVAKSSNGGESWSPPIILSSDDGNSHFLDSTIIAADRFKKNTVYVTYQDLRVLVGFDASETYFTRSDDGGATWSPRVVVQSILAADGFPWRVRIESLCNGDLVILSETFLPDGFPTQQGTTRPIDALRSTDGGQTWSRFPIAQAKLVWAVDPVNIIPTPTSVVQSYDLTQNLKTGDLYAVWQDGTFNPNGGPGVVISKSSDGGKTWSDPIPVNPNTLGVQTFTPSVAVAKDGTVGVFFYDFRFYKGPADPSLSTDAWINLFDSDLNFEGEIRLTPESFDIRQAIRIAYTPDATPLTLGDAVELTNQENDFVAAFQVTNPPFGIGVSPVNPGAFVFDPRNRQDVVFVRVVRTGKKSCCSDFDFDACAQPFGEPQASDTLINPPAIVDGTFYQVPGLP